METIVHRIFEAEHLKQVKHEWVRLAGVQFPDSVAEHSFVAMHIGRYLAILEWVDPYKVIATLLFHDLPEARIGDLHRIATRYIKGKDDAEQQIFQEQMLGMPWAEDATQLFQDFEMKRTAIAQVAKDADYLENAFQAKIYVEQGHSKAQIWIDNVGKALKTSHWKQLFSALISSSASDRREKTHLMYIPQSV